MAHLEHPSFVGFKSYTDVVREACLGAKCDQQLRKFYTRMSAVQRRVMQDPKWTARPAGWAVLARDMPVLGTLHIRRDYILQFNADCVKIYRTTPVCSLSGTVTEVAEELIKQAGNYDRVEVTRERGYVTSLVIRPV
jgi:hypothetical protein